MSTPRRTRLPTTTTSPRLRSKSALVGWSEDSGRLRDPRPAEFVDPRREPGLRRRGIVQAPARVGGPRADLDRMALELVHQTKAVLVGDVVAEKDRRAPGERRGAHEFLDRFSLVAAGGLQLEHHLADLHLQR